MSLLTAALLGDHPLGELVPAGGIDVLAAALE